MRQRFHPIQLLNKNVFKFLACFVFANVSQGSNGYPLLIAENNSNHRTPSGKRVVEPEAGIVRDSSEYNREGKDGFIAFELIGFNPLVSTGIMGGMYLGPDEMIDGSWSQGTFEFLGFRMTNRSYEIRYKKFHGNSFYWRGGGMLRTFEYNTNFTEFDKSADTKVKVSSVGVDFAIGNQWQWDTFTMGCDWFGLFVPLTGSYTHSRPDGISDSEYDSEKNEAKKLSMRGHSQLLRFYLGLSF